MGDVRRPAVPESIVAGIDSPLVRALRPPYYAVIFSSQRTEVEAGYEAMAERMAALASGQPGFLGMESARDELGITVSYWESLEAIRQWKHHVEHAEAQRRGREHWYSAYRVRIAKVEREYSAQPCSTASRRVAGQGAIDLSIRPAEPADSGDLAVIYNSYVTDSCITFETDPIDANEMANRIAETREASLPWLVAESAGRLVGYAYASKWKGRCAYRYSVESTVYLDPTQTGKGFGLPLYAALIDAVRGCAMHAVIGGIALPNAASVRLHERLGFKNVAHFRQVGYKQDRWIDVGYWQLLL